MANRRKFIAGLGALATGSAAAMGTGAFSRTESTRSMTVQATGDAAAYLKLNASSQYAEYNSNDVLEIKIDQLNANSDVEIADVFTIENQGTDPVGIFLDVGSAGYAFNSAEASSTAGEDGIYNNLRDAGYKQAGWYDDDISTGEDITGPGALPSAYRQSSENGITKSFTPSANDHILTVGQSISPDFYIFNTPSDPTELDVTGDLVVLAYSEDYVNAGKGP